MRLLALLIASASLATAAQTPINRPLPVPSASHPADILVTAHTADGETLTFSGLRLHGVAWFDRRHDGPYLTDTEIRPIRQLQGRYTSWSVTVTPSDRPDLCTLVPDPEVDNAPALNWCLHTMAEARTPGTVDTLHVPPGIYGYAGPVMLRDSIHIQGAGGAIRLGVHTDRYGHRFTPVAPVGSLDAPGNPTVFRVLDGRAFSFLGLALAEAGSAGEDLNEDERIRLALAQDKAAWFLEGSAAYLGVSDLILDGNGESDLPRLMRAKASSSPDVQRTLRNGLQNSPSHTGLVISVHAGLDVRTVPDPRTAGPVRSWSTPDDRYPFGSGWTTIKPRSSKRLPGAIATVSRVAIRGFAATGILGDYNAHWTLTDIYGADCLWNHTIYKAEGTWDHVTLEGYSWHHTVHNGTDLGTISNLVIRRQVPSPSGRDTGAALDIRLDSGEDLFLEEVYADLGPWSDATGSGPGLPGGRLADLAPSWYNPALYTRIPKPDDVQLHLRGAVVITEGRRAFHLRRAGPSQLDSITVHTDGPFELADPVDRTSLLSISGLSIRDTTALQAPVIQEPTIPTPEVDETRQLEAQIEALEAQIQALRQQLADAEGREANLIDALGEMEGERDAARQALEGIKAALRSLVGPDPAQD